jgi:phage-related protein
VRLWIIREYDAVLSAFLASVKNDHALDQDTHACLQALREKGNLLGLPMSRPLGNGIFELRPHTHEVHARLLYYFGTTEKGEPKAVFTNTFIKQTKTTPREEIELAKSRRKELEDQAKAKKKQSPSKARNQHSLDNYNGHRTYH